MIDVPIRGIHEHDDSLSDAQSGIAPLSDELTLDNPLEDPIAGDETEDQDAATSRAVQKYEKEARDLAAGWHMSDRGREAVARAMLLTNTKHALYAHAPLICKGDASPCAPVCELAQNGDAPYGERCPFEVIALSRYFQAYCNDLKVDVDNMVDLGLIRELAEVEVQLERISKRLANEDWIQDVAVGVDREGMPISRPEIHKAFEIQERLRNRKDKLLDQLHATRKAKAKSNQDDDFDPSKRAAMLLQKAREMAKLEEERRKAQMIDVEPEFAENDSEAHDEMDSDHS